MADHPILAVLESPAGQRAIRDGVDARLRDVTQALFNDGQYSVGLSFQRALAAPREPAPERAACYCHRCIREHDIKGPGGLPLSSTQMIVCPTCGNKRCPHASDHRLACTGSNKPGQPGSIHTAEPAREQFAENAKRSQDEDFRSGDHGDDDAVPAAERHAAWLAQGRPRPDTTPMREPAQERQEAPRCTCGTRMMLQHSVGCPLREPVQEQEGNWVLNTTTTRPALEPAQERQDDETPTPTPDPLLPGLRAALDIVENAIDEGCTTPSALQTLRAEIARREGGQ